MKIDPLLFGLTPAQWKEARQFYSQAFGDDAMWSAHPSVIRKYWMETEKPNVVENNKKRIRRKKIIINSNKPEIVPAPEKKNLIEEAMRGVSYS